MGAFVTISIFAATPISILRRPWRIAAGWWAVMGAGMMLLARRVTVAQARETIWVSRSALLFLLALLLLSALVEASGFFEWAALHASRAARGDGRRLFRYVFVLGALVTIFLSLDTTAVIVTSIVVAMADRLKVAAKPYVVATAFVANVGSLLLPISNLTNLLFADAFGMSFGRFALAMALPQLGSLLVVYFMLDRRYRSELSKPYDAAHSPAPATAVVDRLYFRAACTILFLVFAGYFVTPLLGIEPYLVGFVGAVVLGVVGVARRIVGKRTMSEISWNVFPLVMGLFVVVRGLENLDFVGTVAQWSRSGPIAAAALSALTSNLANNLPATLLAKSALVDAPSTTRYAALLGLDIGPMILPTGSLATLLVVDVARKKGAGVSSRELFYAGAMITPIALICALLALLVSPYR